MLDRIKQTISIRARLSGVLLLLLVVVIVVGLESLRSLRFVNDAAAAIRTRSLPSIHAPADLNNFTTDFPAADAMRWHADSTSEQAAIDRQMASRDRGIESAQHAYRQIQHDAAEEVLFSRFTNQWAAYRRLVAQGQSALPIKSDAARPSLLQSLNEAYGAASATLGILTALNARGEREAITESDLAYAGARRRIVRVKYIS
jgi:hypothetical protein